LKLYKNSITEAIYVQAAAHPAAVALGEERGRAITYANLVAQADRMAFNLADRGMRKGDRALLLVRPGIPVMLLALALLRAGASLVLADIGMGREAFESRVRLVEPKWVFAETLLLAAQRIGPLRRALRARNVEIPEIGALGKMRIVSVGPNLPFLGQSFNLGELRREVGGGVPPDEEMLCPGDEALVVFTSGTTALPRGVVHTVGSVGATMEMISAEMRATRNDIIYASSLHLVIPALCAGALAILAPHRFDAESYLRALHKHGVTMTFALPGDLEKVVGFCKRTNRRFPGSVIRLMLGSAPVPAGFLQRLSAVLPANTVVWDVYGMTEMLPICGVTLAEKLAYGGPGDLVGRPLPGVGVRLSDDGELVVSGPNLFSHYLGGDESPVLEHATGDTAFLDDQGRVVLTGRKKDMIIKGAYNIYPSLFEPTIEKVPGVRACAMVGIYRECASDEEIVLVVEGEPGVERASLERTLRRELLHGPLSIDTYAQPDRILFAPLPRSGRSNKIDKKRLRRMIEEGVL